jgi:ATP-dependent RNA helicase DDX1
LRTAAETGSGKTGAFALPVLQIVHEAIVAEAKAAASGRAASGAAATPAPAHQLRMSAEDRDALLAVSADGLVCQARVQGCVQRCSLHVFACRPPFLCAS